MHVFVASDLFLGDWEKSIKEVKVSSGISTIVIVEEEEEVFSHVSSNYFVALVHFSEIYA
jgi:hypothetical protein